MPNDRLEEEDDLNNRMVAILLKSLPAQEPLEVLSSRLLEVVVGDAIDDCLLLLMPADGGAHGADFETKSELSGQSGKSEQNQRENCPVDRLLRSCFAAAGFGHARR